MAADLGDRGAEALPHLRLQRLDELALLLQAVRLALMQADLEERDVGRHSAPPGAQVAERPDVGDLDAGVAAVAVHPAPDGRVGRDATRRATNLEPTFDPGPAARATAAVDDVPGGARAGERILRVGASRDPHAFADPGELGVRFDPERPELVTTARMEADG